LKPSSLQEVVLTHCYKWGARCLQMPPDASWPLSHDPSCSQMPPSSPQSTLNKTRQRQARAKIYIYIYIYCLSGHRTVNTHCVGLVLPCVVKHLLHFWNPTLHQHPTKSNGRGNPDNVHWPGWAQYIMEASCCPGDECYVAASTFGAAPPSPGEAPQ